MAVMDVTRYEEGQAASRIGRASFICVYTIHLYEWLLNLEEEHCLIHTSPWSAVKILYFICRYYPLLVFPFHLWAWMDNHSNSLCHSLIHELYGALVPMQISAQGVVLLRAYAFTGKKMYILLLFSASLLAIFAADIWLYGTQFTLDRHLIGKTGCFGDDILAAEGGTAYRVGLLFLSTFCVDAIATIAVFAYAWKTHTTKGRLVKTFLLHGLLYFVFMSTLNLITATFYFLGNVRTTNGHGLPYALILSNVIACRMILGLRRQAAPTETMELKEQSRVVRQALAHFCQDAIACRGTPSERDTTARSNSVINVP